MACGRKKVSRMTFLARTTSGRSRSCNAVSADLDKSLPLAIEAPCKSDSAAFARVAHKTTRVSKQSRNIELAAWLHFIFALRPKARSFSCLFL
jgi:hypothetical protein